MRRWICLWLLISAAVIVVAILCEGVLHILLAQIAQGLIAQPGVSSALAIVIVLSLDLFLPIPSSLVMILSGAMFGIVGGMLSLLDLLMGNVVGFELTRRYGMVSLSEFPGFMPHFGDSCKRNTRYSAYTPRRGGHVRP